jgi:hypothetical protein
MTIWRDRRNEKPCDEADAFSVAVEVEVHVQKQQDEWQVEAYCVANTDPATVILPSPLYAEWWAPQGELDWEKSLRYLFKKGERIDNLTEDEEQEAIRAFCEQCEASELSYAINQSRGRI